MPDRLDFVRRSTDNGAVEAKTANTQEKKGSPSAGCLVAPLILVGVVGLFFLAYKFGRPEAQGSVAIEGGPSGSWSMNLTACHTRRDITPVRNDGGADAYRTRVLNNDIQSEQGLQILRNTFSNLFADDDIEILHGPREKPTDDDLRALARFMSERWHIQLVTGEFPPIDITPDMCTHFVLDMQLAGSNNLPKDNDGRLELECKLPDGRTLKAHAEYDACG